MRDNGSPMGMPTWWNERRLGLFVNASLASVPAWSPIGEYSGWYRSHMGDSVTDVRLHPQPMVEVLAHHRDRWGHIARYDDFLPLLTYDEFDAESWARLAVDAGAGYTVLVSKHHDGLAWWDAPNSQHTALTGGPMRNVLAEYAAACERNGVVFGTSYSLLDWGDPRHPGDDYVDQVLHRHVVDLVERYGTSMLWGDGNWGHGRDHWRTGELLERIWSIDPDVVVNDRWWADDDDGPTGRPDTVQTFEYAPPDGIVEGPWELCRGLGSSFCHNRAERVEHHLSGHDIVALLTEVVAKGGHLLLGVGPDAGGTIPDVQAAPLRAAGRWVRSHDWLINGSTPWRTWGDDHVRYLDVEGSLYAVDIDGHARFPALGSDCCRIESVELLGQTPSDVELVRFHQDDDALQLELHRRPHERRPRIVEEIRVYRITHRDLDRPITLFPEEPRKPIALAPLMSKVSAGDIVQLGDGVYTGPVTVPAGVIIRGLGGDRTVIDGGGATAVTLEKAARLEHLSVTGGPPRAGWLPATTVEIVGPSATVLGCRIEGHVVARASDALVRATTAAGVVADGVDRLSVSRCQLTGMYWDVGIHLIGGSGHEVDSCEVHDHLCAIRASDTTGTVVRGNNITARWWGVHLERTEDAHVHGNFVDHTMRGIDIDGGSQAIVDGNAVCDGDSGCVVEWGASDCQVSGNRWERCRIGVLRWEALGLHLHANEAIDLHDTALVTGP